MMSRVVKNVLALLTSSRKRIVQSSLLLSCFLFGFFVCGTVSEVGAAPNPYPDCVWGCTFGYPSEIFLVDTASGNLLKYRSYGGLHFGDIAADPSNTFLYATWWSWGSGGYYNFSQIDANTLDILHTWTLPESINSLHWETGTDNSLFGIHGGTQTTLGDLFRVAYNITISGPDIAVTPVALIGEGGTPSIGSDGDLAQNPLDGEWYATFFPGSQTKLIKINLADPLNSTEQTVLGDTSGNGRTNVGGLAFDSLGHLWGGSWGTASGAPSLDIYTIDITVPNGAGGPPDYNLGDPSRSPHLTGYGITGLSPCTPVTYKVHWNGDQGSYLLDAYFKSSLFVAKLGAIGQYPAWCCDLDNLIKLDEWYPSNNLIDRPVPQLFSSLSSAPAGIVDVPGNMCYVNYLLNQYRLGNYNAYGATWREVQAAIWKFLFNGATHSVPDVPLKDINSGFIVWDKSIMEAIYNDALFNGAGFVPTGGVVGIIVYLGYEDQTTICEIPYSLYVILESLGVL